MPQYKNMKAGSRAKENECDMTMTPNTALEPTATALAVLRMRFSRFIFFGCRESQPVFRGRGSALDR
jgi:hypothetical protein